MASNNGEAKKIIEYYFHDKIQDVNDKIKEYLEKKKNAEIEELKKSLEFTELMEAVENYKRRVRASNFVTTDYTVESFTRELEKDACTNTVYDTFSKSENILDKKLCAMYDERKKLESDRKYDLLVLEQYGKRTKEYQELLKRLENYVRGIENENIG